MRRICHFSVIPLTFFPSHFPEYRCTYNMQYYYYYYCCILYANGSAIYLYIHIEYDRYMEHDSILYGDGDTYDCIDVYLRTFIMAYRIFESLQKTSKNKNGYQTHVQKFHIPILFAILPIWIVMSIYVPFLYV